MNIREIIELKFKKYNVKYNSFLTSAQIYNYPYACKIQLRLEEDLVFLSYQDDNNWFAFSEQRFFFSNEVTFRSVLLKDIKFCKVDIMNEINEGRKSKDEYCTICLELVSGELIYLPVESNGAGFFVSDIIYLVIQKSKL